MLSLLEIHTRMEKNLQIMFDRSLSNVSLLKMVYDNYRKLELRFRQESYLCFRATFRHMSIGKVRSLKYKNQSLESLTKMNK